MESSCLEKYAIVCKESHCWLGQEAKSMMVSSVEVQMKSIRKVWGGLGLGPRSEQSSVSQKHEETWKWEPGDQTEVHL
jgi:hypothetical protein